MADDEAPASPPQATAALYRDDRARNTFFALPAPEAPLPDLRVRLQKAVGGKFRIVRELTGGGMARVFLAEDVELEREVAIKVLSPHLTDESFLQRFRNEVLQTARLQHPTIVSVFDLGTIEGDGQQVLPYYVMPYVRGESLRARLKHEGSLSVGITARILRSVLDALVHAHAHGVVHRDIKPENIFLSGTSAVVADFGVAKAIAGPHRSATITGPGTTVGTPTYMAPEQIAGDDGTDARADLYSVGVVAFEMLTGRLPWEAGTTSEMIAAKARGTFSSLRAIRGDVPEALATVIERCLEWEPARRPQSAEEMLRAVESIALTPTTPTAVTARALPRPLWSGGRSRTLAGLFVMTAAISLGWWTLGRKNASPHGIRLAVLNPVLGAGAIPDSTLGHQLYHQLLASLYPVPGLQLVDETEISRMSELGVSPDQIVGKLRSQGYDSALVMEAVADKGGGFQLRLALQHMLHAQRELIGDPIVLLTLDRLSPDSVRALVDLLTEKVVSRFRLTSAIRNVRETGSTSAGVARSRGKDARSTRTPEGIRKAIGYYQESIRLDTMYAQAYADLADALTLSVFYRYRTDEPPYEKMATALRMAGRAIALQPTMADGLTARGYIGMVAGAPPDFIRQSYSKARTLNPENLDSRLWYVGLLAIENKYTQALDTLQELVRLDPQSPGNLITIALYSLPPHRYADVIANAAQARAFQPGIPFTAALQLWGLVMLGGDRLQECLSVDAGPFLGARAACLERTKGKAAAQPVLDSLFQLLTNAPATDAAFDGSLYASEMAMYAALHREEDSARQWIRKAFQESPLGVEARFLRSGAFSNELVQLGDSLRLAGWKRIVEAAARKPDR